MPESLDHKISTVEQRLLYEFENLKGELLREKQKNLELEKLLGSFRSLLAAIPDLAYLLDLKGNLLVFNQTVCEALNKSAEKIQGSNMFEMTPSTMIDKRLSAFHYVVQTGAGIKLKDQMGARIYDNYLQPILGENSYVNSVAVFSRDITDYENQKRSLEESNRRLGEKVDKLTQDLIEAKKSLQTEVDEHLRTVQAHVESHRLYQTLVETARDTIWTLSLDLKYSYVSPSVIESLGYTVDEIMQISPLDTLTPQSREEMLKIFREEMEIEKRQRRSGYVSRTVEVQQFHENGLVKWKEITVTFLRDDKGRPIGILGVTRDIDNRKRIEDELRRSKEVLEQKVMERTSQLKKINEWLLLEIARRERIQADLRSSENKCSTILDVAQDYIFIKDTGLKYTTVNKAFSELLGVSIDNIIGKTANELGMIKDISKVLNAERRVLNGQIVENEYSLGAAPYLRHVSAVTAPIRNSSGKVVGLCGIARDITERKELEKRTPGGLEKFTSVSFRKTINELSMIASSDSTILMLGESGVGKDYLARYVHDSSRRAGAPFFAINCAALTVTLAESELFGHEAGAFTGVMGRKRGLVELAEGGTLLLNEIGELPLQLQSKLLSFLDTQCFTRVGGEREISVNTRILSATNKNITEEVQNGLFRADLYFRLNVFTVTIPPLRQRSEDLPILIENIITFLTRKLGLRKKPDVERSLIQNVIAYSWPGNVRELKNALERALILSGGKKIRTKDLGLTFNKNSSLPRTLQTPHESLLDEGESFSEAVKRLKSAILEEALRNNRGSVTRSAKDIGLTRDAMKSLMKSFELRRDDFK